MTVAQNGRLNGFEVEGGNINPGPGEKSLNPTLKSTGSPISIVFCCFTTAWLVEQRKVKRRCYEEHFQLNVCPVLPTPLPLSLHCCHLPTVPFFISLYFLPISPPCFPYVHSHTKIIYSFLPLRSSPPQCGCVLACLQSTLTYLAATGAHW